MSGEGMTCHEMIDRLSLYLDGELRPQVVHEVERHLEHCSDCRHCAEEIRATIRLIKERAYEPLAPLERQRMRERLWQRLRGAAPD